MYTELRKIFSSCDFSITLQSEIRNNKMTRSQLVTAISDKRNFLCVGLDTAVNLIPLHLGSSYQSIITFNKSIIDATIDHCVSYKINTAFYESMGSKGWDIIGDTLNYIPSTHFTIADAKRGDIGNTSSQYAKTFFETFNFDSVTVAPYMGEDSIRPFLEYENKVTIVLGLTSNKGAFDFQYQLIDGEPLFLKVIKKVAKWGTKDNLMFVVGATKSNDLSIIRQHIPEHFLLIPGVGAQGGSLEDVAKYGLNKEVGLLVNLSRGIIYASHREDYEKAATEEAFKYASQMRTIMENSFK